MGIRAAFIFKMTGVMQALCVSYIRLYQMCYLDGAISHQLAETVIRQDLYHILSPDIWMTILL